MLIRTLPSRPNYCDRYAAQSGRALRKVPSTRAFTVGEVVGGSNPAGPREAWTPDPFNIPRLPSKFDLNPKFLCPWVSHCGVVFYPEFTV